MSTGAATELTGGRPHHLLIRVQHHPSRAPLLDRLLAGLAPHPVEVITDPEPDGQPSAWRSYRACLTRPHDADQLVIVQDDVALAAGFAEQLPAIAAAHPDQLTLLFVSGAPSGWQRQVALAARQGRRWTTCPADRQPSWTPAVANVWPAALAAEFVSWADAWIAARGKHQVGDDPVIGAWVRATGQQPVACVPSVVQHPDDQPSVVNPRVRGAAGRNRQRIACVFTGTANYDWHVETREEVRA